MVQSTENIGSHQKILWKEVQRTEIYVWLFNS